MNVAAVAGVTDLLRQAADELAAQAEISAVSWERDRLHRLAVRCRDTADVLADEALSW